MLTLLIASLLLVPRATPQAAAQSEIRARAEERLEAFLKAGRVPGVSAGLAGADFELALAAGQRERGGTEALQPDDLLCAGSTGKTFVAAVVLQLVEEGKLGLDEYAGERLGSAEWFERLPNATELTVDNLLSHRSGLPRYEFQPAFERDLLAQPDRVWKPEELLSYVLGHDPEVEANVGFAYADTNYIVLGMLVESVTGKTLYDEVRRRLLEPLRLTHVRPQDARRIPGLIQGHAGKSAPLGAPDLVLDQDGTFYANPQFEWAGGGFVSSGGDLARWARALWGGRVVKPETLEQMCAGRSTQGQLRGAEYGLGTIVRTTPHGRAVGHEGFFPGYMSDVRYWPELDLAVAVQVNTSDFAALGMPLGRLCEELLQACLPE